MSDLRELHRRTQATYHRHAQAWDRYRPRQLTEQPWLERLAAFAPAPGPILDVGCGAGEPIAQYFIDRGYGLVGVDFADAMIDIARQRWPKQTWLVADMRTLQLDTSFAGIVAWDSFFHLSADEQRVQLATFASHLRPGGGLLTTVGDRAAEVVGTVEGDDVYHASLSPEGYADAASAAGLQVEALTFSDKSCGGRSILLARRAGG